MAGDIPELTKDPGDRLDYGWDWNAPAGGSKGGPWLSGGDTITASTWTVTGPDSLLTIASTDLTTTVTRAWLTGGTLGADYTLTNHATTAQGRQVERSMVIRVRNR